ncbi:MAG TPA: hypothetical protein DD381_12520 [Lentisphaeria bacterium]|nr:MAG: hypothetical protein A2X47_12090 [Lentisphaerae bacterium GWF2_38_69]HBM17148.1 hypothetical protein [Lentisphaeria bacterium]
MDAFLSTTLVMFFIMDPLGNIPIFLSALKSVKPDRRKKVLTRELFISLIVILLFFFIGKYIMSLMHFTQESISISGGLILLIIALKMIFPQSHDEAEKYEDEPFIVPLAIPLVAGPSAFAVIILLPQVPLKTMFLNLGAILTAWLVTAVILTFSTSLYKILKEKGVRAVERLMGMLLVIMATQMLINGIRTIISSSK